MTLKLKSICTSEIVDVTIYKEKIGPLLYFTNTRLNIFFVESRCVHMVLKKHMVWYLKGTIEYGRAYMQETRGCSCRNIMTLIGLEMLQI